MPPEPYSIPPLLNQGEREQKVGSRGIKTSPPKVIRFPVLVVLPIRSKFQFNAASRFHGANAPKQNNKHTTTLPIKAPVGNSAPPIEAGSYAAVCYGVVSIGTIPQANSQFAPKPKVIIIWELPTERGDFGEKKNQPRAISARYTLSLGDKATLRKVLESWRGKKFTTEELSSFEIDKLIGANCLISLVHDTRGDKTYVNVATVSPLAKGMQKYVNENPRLYFNLEEALNTSVAEGKDPVFPSNMPEWMVNLTKTSDEYLEHVGGKTNPPNHPTDAQMANQTGEDSPDVPF